MRPHSVDEISPACLQVTLRGRVEVKHVRALQDIATAACADGTAITIIADLRTMGKVPSASRRAFRDGLGKRRVRAIAVVGLSAPVRTLATLVFKAVNAIRPRPVQVAFFADLEASRRWLARY